MSINSKQWSKKLFTILIDANAQRRTGTPGGEAGNKETFLVEVKSTVYEDLGARLYPKRLSRS